VARRPGQRDSVRDPDANAWRAVLAEIRHDNRAGATALLGRAADVLALAAGALPLLGPGWRQELTAASRELAAVRPALGAIYRLAGLALGAAERAETPAEARAGLTRTAGRFVGRVARQAPAIADRAAGLLPPEATVVTISASSLVERALLAAARAGRPPRVVCLESRPALEGRALAARLAAAGVSVRLLSDAAGPAMAGRADLVLLGGDTLAPAGLIHKVGTLGLVLAAGQRGVPVYALCGSEKWLPAPLRGALDDGGPAVEIWPDPAPGVTVGNPYFDQTPLALLAGLVGPTRLYGPAEAARLARRVRLHPALRDLLDE
jgi:translation initiation factor 2B subunit (eIF-2B alpha/beta/delta family)